MARKVLPLDGAPAEPRWRAKALESKARPAYAVTSVDHALRIATMLQIEGYLTVSEIATRLGIAVSTAHRLLAMLVYRDFAVRGPHRRYGPGPVLTLGPALHAHAAGLREVALPHLARLVATLGESANLIIRTGTQARFIAGVESPRELRVGDREGMVFPVHRVSSGLILLAELTEAQLQELYAGAPDSERPQWSWLTSQLGRVRRRGVAVNQGLSERGVHAVGVAVRHPGTGSAVAGVSVSMPSVRYVAADLPRIVTVLRACAGAIGADLESMDEPERQGMPQGADLA